MKSINIGQQKSFQEISAVVQEQLISGQPETTANRKDDDDDVDIPDTILWDLAGGNFSEVNRFADTKQANNQAQETKSTANHNLGTPWKSISNNNHAVFQPTDGFENVNHDVGSLGITPVAFDNSELTVDDPTSIIEFDISSSRYVHITLAHLNAGNDGNLKLYLDNGNSIFDNGDTLVSSPTFGKGNDESIDYKAQAGTYFVEVSRNKYTNNNDPLLYSLKMSATLINNRVSNLVVGEFVVGDITSNTPIKAGYLGIGDEDTTDTYAFSLETYEGVNISLSGLDSDANLRLIRDTNNNGIVDSGEVVDGSYTFGASDEQINNITLSGPYFLQVFQGLYGWPTPYTLEFDHFTTPHP